MLGFALNEEQDAFRLAVRDWAARALAPRVEELEATETFPVDLFRELGRLGYLGVGIPEAEGGSGGDMVMRCLLIEEIGRVNCGFAAALLGHVGLATIPLIKYGTAEQKAAYLRPALAGEKLGCFGLSEPNSGSDAA
jgi:alkylation response protein AidB-like acyl-CoA dehydrogenase